jgi:hypothetical protein
MGRPGLLPKRLLQYGFHSDPAFYPNGDQRSVIVVPTDLLTLGSVGFLMRLRPTRWLDLAAVLHQLRDAGG